MTNKISNFQKAKILALFSKHAGSTGEVKFTDEIYAELRTVISNPNYLDDALYKLSDDGVIHYEETGEDGFSPIIIATTTPKTHAELFSIIQEIEASYLRLEDKIESIFTFNPKAITEKILSTNRNIQDIEERAKDNEILRPLISPLLDKK